MKPVKYSSFGAFHKARRFVALDILAMYRLLSRDKQEDWEFNHAIEIDLEPVTRHIAVFASKDTKQCIEITIETDLELGLIYASWMLQEIKNESV